MIQFTKYHEIVASVLLDASTSGLFQHLLTCLACLLSCSSVKPLQIPNYLELLLHNRSLRRRFERFSLLHPLKRSSYRCNKWTYMMSLIGKDPFDFTTYIFALVTRNDILLLRSYETRKLWFWISTKMVDGGNCNLSFLVGSILKHLSFYSW